VKFTKIIREDIIPLLEEYCYEDYSTLEKILGKGLVDTNNQKIRHDLFDPLQKEKIIYSLLSPCPEIATTLQAVTFDSGVSEEETASTDNDQDPRDDP